MIQSVLSREFFSAYPNIAYFRVAGLVEGVESDGVLASEVRSGKFYANDTRRTFPDSMRDILLSTEDQGTIRLWWVAQPNAARSTLLERLELVLLKRIQVRWRL